MSGPGNGERWELDETLDDLESRAEARRSRRARPRRPRQKKAPPPPSANLAVGTVVSRTRGRYRVDLGTRTIACSLRGRLHGGEVPVVGDRVSVSLSSEHRGVVEDVRPRRNLLSRVSEEDDSAFQIIAANLDRLVVVLAAEPFPPRWVLADRLLVLAEREGFEAALVVNKIDLAGAAARKSIATAAEAYARIGVPLVGTSALEGTGLERLRECLEGQLSLLCGHSGVGKSSLLNRLCPGVELATGAVNEQTGKGRHTTTVARLVKLPFGGYLVDTPGFREFGLGHVAPAELGRFYPEFRPVIGHCRFSNCLHRDEPGCALKRAVDRAEVSNFRYQNYLQILAGLVEKGL